MDIQSQEGFYHDIKLVCNLINSEFSAIFPDFRKDNINKALYYDYVGMEQNMLTELYEKCYMKNIFHGELSEVECFIILSIIAPYYFPDTFSFAKVLMQVDTSSFTMIGGRMLGDNKCFYPTSETLLFFLAGHNVKKRVEFTKHFSSSNRLFKLGLIDIGAVENGSPLTSGQLIPKPELISILKGETYQPEYDTSFPASRIETRMDWGDLVLPYETHEGLEELKIWMRHGDALIQHKDIGKRIKPGYRCLFYGPPGTGKTLTAALIGKSTGLPVYRIDLSMVVSKWVGETEKNLRGIFDQATDKNWILFFDEADSLFGKRTGTNSSNDRYANQEVSYLLQRIEDFSGLVILASNLKSNIDEAFNRRFQATINFPMPDSEIRQILWKKAFPDDFPLEKQVSLYDIAKKYEMAGGAIINVVRYCVLKALDRQEDNTILLEDIEHSLIREFKKEGKIVS